MASKKKVSKKELNEISKKDVYKAIERWNSDEISDEILEAKKPKYESKTYYLCVDGKYYPSKPILAIAYGVHYGKKIKPSELEGGKKGVCAQLGDRLGFEIVLKNELSENFSIGSEKEKNPLETILRKEGKKKEFYVTKYERNTVNRKEAIKIHGLKCMICQFDFEEVYGEAGRNFIEVHHIKPLAKAKEEIKVNPKTDLVCVCANCHSIIHRKRDRIYSMEEMKAMVGDKVVGLKDKR